MALSAALPMSVHKSKSLMKPSRLPSTKNVGRMPPRLHWRRFSVSSTSNAVARAHIRDEGLDLPVQGTGEGPEVVETLAPRSSAMRSIWVRTCFKSWYRRFTASAALR